MSVKLEDRRKLTIAFFLTAGIGFYAYVAKKFQSSKKEVFSTFWYKYYIRLTIPFRMG